MVRAVLLALLTLSAVSCKSHDESQAKSQSIAAGKVLEVTGSVTLHHGTESRPLAKGDMIDADDEVETGADGSAVIEVQHNNVNWELGPGKRGKLRESLAWTQPKKDTSGKAVEQDSTAAGRHAERTAAESSVTASAPPAPQAEAARADEAPGAAAPAAAIAPAAPPTGGAADEKKQEKSAPPPPPPPKITAKSRAMDSSKSAGVIAPSADMAVSSGAGQGGGGAGAGAGRDSLGAASGGGIPPAVAAKTLIETKSSVLKKCAGDQDTTVQLIVNVAADGKATIQFKTKVTPAIEACVKKIINGLSFAKAPAAIAYTIKP